MRAIALLLTMRLATSLLWLHAFPPRRLRGVVVSLQHHCRRRRRIDRRKRHRRRTPPPTARATSRSSTTRPCPTTVRVRMCIYYKELEEDVDIVSPMDLGLQSPVQAVNPQGKMPAMAVVT